MYNRIYNIPTICMSIDKGFIWAWWKFNKYCLCLKICQFVPVSLEWNTPDPQFLCNMQKRKKFWLFRPLPVPTGRGRTDNNARTLRIGHFDTHYATHLRDEHFETTSRSRGSFCERPAAHLTNRWRRRHIIISQRESRCECDIKYRHYWFDHWMDWTGLLVLPWYITVITNH